jgi:RNA polymerase sigma-70 factor (ECF subfamily)
VKSAGAITKLPAIAKLPFEQREVFLLHQEALLTLPQIAEMLQLGIEKIKSRYRYAINKLRLNLENMR